MEPTERVAVAGNTALPVESKVVVAVPPKYAFPVTESCVVDAPPLKMRSDVVADCPAAGWVNSSKLLPTPLIVIGDVPMTVKPVQETPPEQVADVVATL